MTLTLTLTLDRVIRYTVVHQSSTSIYTPSFIEIGKTFSGRTDGRKDVPNDGHFRPPLMLLGRLGVVDLKTAYDLFYISWYITPEGELTVLG